MQRMNIDTAWLQQQFPDFSLLKPLGSGGQKSVFSGNHDTDGNVVLKICHLNTEPERVFREIQAVQNIQSPRVPKIIDVGRTQFPFGPVIWIREERVLGENLRDILANGPLDSRAIIRLGMHILEALATAEQVRIVHRDVKPENIIVASNGDSWLLDFGLARHLDLESLTATANAFGVGTPGYAPPEQFRNKKPEIDARSDLFALGVTLYECVEGVNPFRHGARDIVEVVHRVESRPLPPISRTVDTAGQFRDLILAMTRSRRDHRPVTAADAFQWIQEICAREGI